LVMFDMSDAHPPLQDVLLFAEELAREAGEIIRAAFSSANKVVDFKGQIDLVTETDKAVESMVIGAIRGRYPTHMFVAEESVSAGESVEIFTDAPTWSIDPIDGTTNFVHRFPFCCISIGYVVNKVSQVGVIYNPILDEMFTAIRGRGAFKNGVDISVSRTEELKKSLAATGFPYDRSDANIDRILKRLRSVLLNVRDVRRAGSAALDMCYVAAGVLDFYYEFGVHAWDVAAGALIVEEAGGKVSLVDGTTPFDMTRREVLATNGRLHESVIKVIELKSA